MSSWLKPCAGIALGICLTLSLLITASSAQTNRSRNSRKTQEAARQAAKAARVFDQIMGAPDRRIPQDLLDRAEAIGVFPGVVKAGILIVGGRGGRGVISRRIPGGWSAPAFFNIGGGSIGPQIGASSTDFILLFMNEEAVGSLLKNKVELGAEASVAAGPVGRAAAASTDAALNAQILSYSRSKGLFAGLELKGAVINPDNNDNLQVYGLKASDILTGTQHVEMPAGISIFPDTLRRYSRR
ncbi:MAG TPA: lipid-binding SYLF domain-containing protein [Pyrinomonadaceae bacterium]|nr:lipid-binding SYLF domain-containing protein [Pyrinomonadaceae bacterium]